MPFPPTLLVLDHCLECIPERRPFHSARLADLSKEATTAASPGPEALAAKVGRTYLEGRCRDTMCVHGSGWEGQEVCEMLGGVWELEKARGPAGTELQKVQIRINKLVNKSIYNCFPKCVFHPFSYSMEPT